MELSTLMNKFQNLIASSRLMHMPPAGAPKTPLFTTDSPENAIYNDCRPHIRKITVFMVCLRETTENAAFTPIYYAPHVISTGRISSYST